MRHIDVFNGDADGICALTQLRLAEPRDSQLVTGVKRDIDLLEKVDAKAGDKITVLDVSLDKNREPLLRALAAGAEVLYVDHHFAGEIPASDKLTAHINEAPDVCTSLLVNGLLKNRFLAWAVTGAFGDNLKKSAETMAKGLSISEAQLRQLEDLGTYLPDAPWARRVSGVYSNNLVNLFPDRAHAVLTEKAGGSYLVSVRAPLNRKKGADELCRSFPTGGGRAAAAGINDLPAEKVGEFMRQFQQKFAV